MTEALIAIAIAAVQLIQTPQAYEKHTRTVAQYEARHDAAHAPLYVLPPPQPVAGFGKWEPILQCESGGDWYLNTGNGYYGGLQFSLRSWQWVGGTGYPHEASPSEQVLRAEKLLQLQGWGAWPVCSRKAGYR